MRRVTVAVTLLLALGLALLPSVGDAQQAPAVPGAIQQMAQKIDLNKATDAQLKSLPGLNSDDMVKKVKDARPFKQIDDLKKVVPAPVFEQLKNLVMVAP
jgi:DNA uptake protein ComE-like DNA-binding protein